MKHPALLALAAAPVLVLSACGSSSSSSTATDSGGGTGTGSTPPAVNHQASGHGLHVASTSLGKVLVDANGRTVYMFSPDSAGTSTCDATCLQYWPPVAPGKAAATVTGKVASTSTTAGGKIATVGGWPVYTFIEDQQPGDVKGEGFSDFGGVWYAVSPSGQPVKSATPAQPSSSSSGYTAPGHGY
jgi:predicted lipoprotein with Yx(FWY)xxD motif